VGQAGPRKPRPFIWHLRVTRAVLQAIRAQPEPVRVACLDLVRGSTQNPYDRSLGVMQLKSVNAPNLYTVPIGTAPRAFGLLTYQVTIDHPTVHLFDVVFFESRPAETP